MPEDRRPMQQTTAMGRPASPPQPEPKPEQPPPPPEQELPRLIEVNLVRRYCPHHLVDSDGNTRPNGGDMLETLAPTGTMLMHPDDAQIALESGAALPTRKTFKM
jgi:hypothetical protein